MIERTVTVVPEDGLHARPASKFVETANEYDSEITVATDGGDPVNAASMLAVGDAAGIGGEIQEEFDDATLVGRRALQGDQFCRQRSVVCVRTHVHKVVVTEDSRVW